MSQYDDLKTGTYKFAAVNFATGSTQKIVVPRTAKLARVLDIQLANCTVAFTQVTTPALVQVGDGTTANAFAALTVGALAVGSSIGGADQTGGIFTAVYQAGNYSSGAGLHDLIVTFVAPTGGTPAGTADVTILIGWDEINP